MFSKGTHGVLFASILLLGGEAQSKLLRAIETGIVERVGGGKTIQVDVRVLSATNHDLRAQVQGGAEVINMSFGKECNGWCQTFGLLAGSTALFDAVRLALELGLTRRGYNVLREIELESTGDRVVDAWLERATTSLAEHMPPFRSTRRGGLVTGEATGACVPWLEEAPAPAVEASPGASGRPPADAAPGAAAASS